MIAMLFLISGCSNAGSERNGAAVNGQKSTLTQKGLAEGIRVLADVPTSTFSDNWPGNGLPAWGPDGHRILYTAPDKNGPAMVLDLNTSEPPRPITYKPAYDPAWSPDGQAIAFISGRQEPGRSFGVGTIYLQRLEGGEAVDLLPGDLAIQSVSTAKCIHRWVDNTLLYEEHMGTAMQQLFVLNTVTKELFTSRELGATYFIWNADGDRVAGQYNYSKPYRFWVWDRNLSKFLKPKERIPGEDHLFEAWSDDGRSALYTAWKGGFPYPDEKGGTPTLYRLDVEQGQSQKIADNATLAAWSGDMIAYIEWGPELTLVVSQTDGKVLWKEDLGALPAEAIWDLDQYHPTFVGPYLCYRTAGDEWRVSPKERKDPRTIYVGKEAAFSWSPDGRYAALLENGTSVRLRVVENPLVSNQRRRFGP